MRANQRVVQAAGCVPWRRRDGSVEVLLVHRPKYDDWTFPKGKLDPGESHENAARRELHEETGIEGDLGRELAGVSYRDAKGRPKTVRYWEVQARHDPSFTPNEEVDEVRWVGPAAARRLLSYAHDEVVVDALEQLAGSQDPDR